MIEAFDHVAVLVADADAAAVSFTAAGFTVAHRENEGGGDYAQRRIVSFHDDSYIELLSFNHEVPAARRHSWYRLDPAGEGFADYSIATDDVADLVARADLAGFAHTPVIEEHRRRLDGTEWAVRGSGFGIFGTPTDGRPEYPFVLEDLTAHGIRSDGPREHPNGASGITRVTIVTDDPDSAHPGLAFFTGCTDPLVEAHPEGSVLIYPSGPLSVALLAPRAGSGAASRLAAVGPVVHEVTLSSDRGSGTSPLTLDTALTHGARFVLAPAGAARS